MVVALVNGYKITEKEFKTELKDCLQKSHIKQANREIKKTALEHLIDGYLLLEIAKNADIEISQNEIDDRLLDMMLKYRTQKDFQMMLFDQNLDTDLLKKKICNDILIEKYFKLHFSPAVSISTEKLEEMYCENIEAFKTKKMVQASHILIKGHDDKAFLRIKKIRERINSPEDFKREVKLCSECPSCCREGELGFFSKGMMVKEFEEKAFNMQVNEISDPVKTNFGYHIIMVTAKKGKTIAKFDQVKDTLAKRLKQIDCELKLIRHLKMLRANAEIMIYEDLL